jgi:plasmid stabilization system protein ParE
VNIRLSRRAFEDLDWFFMYYETRFPEGHKNAVQSYLRTLRLLRENPLAGLPVPGRRLRSFPILKTPFNIVYHANKNEIIISRVRDMRSRNAALIT